jgi:hypothetical protein
VTSAQSVLPITVVFPVTIVLQITGVNRDDLDPQSRILAQSIIIIYTSVRRLQGNGSAASDVFHPRAMASQEV